MVLYLTYISTFCTGATKDEKTNVLLMFFQFQVKVGSDGSLMD